MKYDTPELTALTPAISAVQRSGNKSLEYTHPDNIVGEMPEQFAAYADWE
jgi:hypothetical protein